MAILKATAVLCVLVLTGCQLDESGKNQISNSSYAGLTNNGLTNNGLTNNGLAIVPLSGNSEIIHSLLDTAYGAVVLRYLTLCALEEGESLVFQHDGEEIAFPGILGLAPAWADRALNVDESRWMSACLLAHTNAVGASVTISTRAINKLFASKNEQTSYSTYEGTFFGQLFDENGVKIYSCIGDNDNIALANSDDRINRICSDETSECAIVSLGRCRDVCDTRTANNGWTDCWAEGVRYEEAISVYLHSDDADSNNATCDEDGNCNFTVKKNEAGVLDCSEAGNCRTTCKKDSICSLDGTGANEFKAVVKKNSIADVNCHETNSCNVKVKHSSSVEIDCKDANECRSGVKCTDGSDCLLDCTGAVDCGFKVCEGQLTQCQGDIWVCNRDCP